MIRKLDKIVSRLTAVVSTVSFVGICAIVLIISVDVFLRKAFNSSIRGAYEMVQYILMCAVFASFAYAQSLHGHVRVTMFVMKMPRGLRFAVTALTCLGASIAAGVLSYAASTYAQTAFSSNYTSGVLYMPLYPFYWLEVVCMAIFALTLLWDVVKHIAAIWDKDLAEDIEETWN